MELKDMFLYALIISIITIIVRELYEKIVNRFKQAVHFEYFSSQQTGQCHGSTLDIVLLVNMSKSLFKNENVMIKRITFDKNLNATITRAKENIGVKDENIFFINYGSPCHILESKSRMILCDARNDKEGVSSFLDVRRIQIDYEISGKEYTSDWIDKIN